jgi:hypothetical protein
MAERSRWTDERMDDFVAHITARFDQVDARFAEIDRRFDRLETRFDRLEIRMDRLEIRVERLTWVTAAMIVTQLVGFVTMGLMISQV